MQKTNKKKRIGQLYAKGYKVKEITEIINIENKKDGIKRVTQSAIKKCIQNNFKDLKKIHKINALARKEAFKAVNYESKKYISDKSFILKNRSAYVTKSNGDIVIKNDYKRIASADMPKRLVNENKIESLA